MSEKQFNSRFSSLENFFRDLLFSPSVISCASNFKKWFLPHNTCAPLKNDLSNKLAKEKATEGHGRAHLPLGSMIDYCEFECADKLQSDWIPMEFTIQLVVQSRLKLLIGLVECLVIGIHSWSFLYFRINCIQCCFPTLLPSPTLLCIITFAHCGHHHHHHHHLCP